MPYTPELSQESCTTLRRIAWAYEKPMTQAINIVFGMIPNHLDSKVICGKCRDRSRCTQCGFSSRK